MARILIIEDDEDVRDLLRDVLEDEGYEVLIAADGNAATEVYEEQAVDLVITDILMPGKDGIETIADLQRHDSDVGVIAISGGGRVQAEAYLESAELLGAVSTLTKPFRREDLLSAVAEGLARRRR